MSRIILADDDDAFRSALALVLTERGHEVREAGDGREALEQALSDPPDLLITDLRMPGLNGVALARRVRARWTIPILVISAQARAAGLTVIDRWLMKPVAAGRIAAEADRLVQVPRPVGSRPRPRSARPRRGGRARVSRGDGSEQ